MKRDRRFIQSIIEGQPEEKKIEILSQELAKIFFEARTRSASKRVEKWEDDRLGEEIDDLYEMLNICEE